MFQYRQVLVRMRQGDSDRDIKRARLMGRRKAAELQKPRGFCAYFIIPLIALTVPAP